MPARGQLRRHNRLEDDALRDYAGRRLPDLLDAIAYSQAAITRTAALDELKT